jgi:bifunctional non-homologous end joining protein LigD
VATLDEYRKKRDFRRTPEPAGESRPARGSDEGLFVVQKHAAQSLHYDLRLEQDGVLRSWAVPKGPSLDPGEKRLAVQVEDHPLEYGEFEGVIPEGEYGGGTVMLWDRGRWRARGKTTDERLDFELEGSKLRGAWTLVRMSGPSAEEGRNWLLIKRSEDADGSGSRGKRRPASRPAGNGKGGNAGATWERSVSSGRTMRQIASDRDAIWTSEGLETSEKPRPPDAKSLKGSRVAKLPKELSPQLATLVDGAPDGDEWLHEIKFDGYRILARVESGVVQLLSRNGLDWTSRFPRIAELLENLASDTALLDGEVVSFESDGSTSFRGVQEALSEDRTERLVYQAFDLVHLGGRDLSRVPLLERKRALAGVLAASGFGGSGAVRYTDHLIGKGPGFFERACALGLEGIISKRLDGQYRPGRGKGWLKAKCTRHQELLIGGFSEPGGSRSGFGALLLGAYDQQGDLIYTGKVGTGFTDRQLQKIHAQLREVETAKSPFSPVPPGRGVHWVRPVLVAEVEFTEWTRDGVLRHPTFRGLRDDREPEEIRLPSPREMQVEGVGGTGVPGGKARAESGSGSVAGSRADTSRATGGTKAPRTGRKRSRAKEEIELAGVWLSSPEKVLYPEQGVTKLALANYYEDIAEWIMPYLENRPLALVRCPHGLSDDCFFQKHPTESLFKGMERIEIEESDGSAPYLYVRSLADIITLVQAGVLELHVWGSRVDDVEKPDILVFDLDPAPGVPWQELVRVARELRQRLQELGLESFVRTTGGKGLHLVVPLRRGVGWEEAKEFAQGVAVAHAQDDRSRLTTNMSKAKRKGRIFLDYLRNGRGATAIASYSSRAREGAPVAVPVRWDEVNGALRPDRYGVDNLRRRLAALRSDPWEGFDAARRPITKKMLAAVGAGGK